MISKADTTLKSASEAIHSAADESAKNAALADFNTALGTIERERETKSDAMKQLNAELKEMRESEIWQTGETVRKLRPERN